MQPAGSQDALRGSHSTALLSLCNEKHNDQAIDCREFLSPPERDALQWLALAALFSLRLREPRDHGRQERLTSRLPIK